MTDFSQPLRGITVLITRPENQSEDFETALEALGAESIAFPVIETHPAESWEKCDRALINIRKYDGIIFTSANSVDYFFNRAHDMYPQSIDYIKRRPVYAVGKKTVEIIQRNGISHPIYPDRYTAVDLVSLIKKRENIEGKFYLFPCGNLARPVIEDEIMKLGGVVDRVVVYRTLETAEEQFVKIEQLLRKTGIDIITFFSPSAADAFFSRIDPALIDPIPIAVVGTTTADAVTKNGVTPKIIAAKSTSRGMVDAIVKYMKKEGIK